MSFHNRRNTRTNQNSIPDITASFVADTTTSIHSGISNLTGNTSRNSQVNYDSSSLRQDREREGRCADCGVQTHEIRYDRESGSTRKVPLTIEGEVRRGRCLLCNPLPVGLSMQRCQLQQQHHRRSENIDGFDNVHSDGGSPVAQQYHLHDGSFDWQGLPQAGHSGASRSVDGDRYQEHRQNPHQVHKGRGSDISAGSAQSCNSAPVFRGALGSHQAPEQCGSIYPLATQSAPNLSGNENSSPIEEFTIDSSRGENLRQHHLQQQPQRFRDPHAASSWSSNLNIMSINESQAESHEFHSTDRRNPQQQELSSNEELSIRAILSSMQGYPFHIPTQSKALHSLWVLSWENSNASIIGRLGGIPLIIDSMRLRSNTTALQSNGIATLQNLAMDTENRDKIIGADGVTVIANVMAQYLDDKAIQQSGCTALANLANGGTEQKSYVAERGGVLAMMRAVNAHRADESILRAAYQALRNLGYNPGSSQLSTVHLP